MKAVFYSKGESVDYRPASAVAAGDVVVQGGLVGIARLDIPAGALGSLAICGLFKVAKATSTVFAAGAPIYWDATNGVAVTSSADAIAMGVAVAAAGSTEDTVIVALNLPIVG